MNSPYLTACPASYSKYKTKEKFIELLQSNPMTPPCDLMINGKPPYGTLNELYLHVGITSLTVVLTDGVVYVARSREGNWVVIDG